MNYKISDNSYCINLKTCERAWLVQDHDEYYSPDKNEDGATFEIVCEPYVEQVKIFFKYEDRTFVNVKSSLTGNIYRVLYEKCNEYEFISNPNAPKMISLSEAKEWLYENAYKYLFGDIFKDEEMIEDFYNYFK